MSVRPTRIIPVAAIVLCPEEIENNNSPFNALHIRTGSPTTFEMFPLDETQVNRYFKQYTPAAQALLLRCNDGDIGFEKSQTRKRLAKEKSGIALDTLVDKSISRYLHELITHLVAAQTDWRCYHRVKSVDHKNVQISRCTIHTKPTRLRFSISKNDTEGLAVHAWIDIEDVTLSLNSFKRYKFLIAQEQDYYLLSIKDYQTIEWLQKSEPHLYAHNELLFTQRIIQKLEESHTVDRGQALTKNKIGGIPTNCIYLSEISDTMLMLTPRWKYEGIVVEGSYKALHETTRNGTLYTIERLQETEEAFVEYVQNLHPSFLKQNNKFFYLSFTEAKKKQWFLKTYHELLAQDIDLIGLEMLKHFRYAAHSPQIQLTLQQTLEDTYEYSITIHFDKEKINLLELQKLFLAGQHTILLKDNSIGVFDEAWMQQYGVLIKHGKIQHQTLRVSKWIVLSLQQQPASLPAVQEQAVTLWKEKWMQWQDANQIICPSPHLLKAQLRPYQQKGFEWMVLLSEIGAGACLADDMGLGKTLQTITLLCYRLEHNTTAKHIIVCPASLIYNWEKEIAQFAPHMSTYVYNGIQRNLEPFIESGASILICTYGTLRNDIDKLNIIPWDVSVVDESQNIKNTQAQITKAALQLNAQFRIALSGTPVMNNTMDLYAQLQYLLPGMFDSAEFFRKAYAQPIDRDGDKEAIKVLQQLIAPYVLRRTKNQVAPDLPEKTEQVLWCSMGEAQTMAYETIKSQIKESLFLNISNNGLEKNKLNILQGILKLRQICGAPELLAEFKHTKDSTKVDQLMAEILKLQNNKALVFSQFKGMLHLIAERCKTLNISYFHFDGDTPAAQRQAMVDQFQSSEDQTRLFLISLKSGNAGLNLTAADYVFLVDPWWNNAVQQQAIDRTHRIGQTKNVFAYKMLCTNTIEEKIMALQEKKQFLSDELVSAEEGFVKNLSMDDVSYLFS